MTETREQYGAMRSSKHTITDLEYHLKLIRYRPANGGMISGNSKLVAVVGPDSVELRVRGAKDKAGFTVPISTEERGRA